MGRDSLRPEREGAGTALEFTSPRVYASKPEIDGQLSENEWNRLAGFGFGERIIAGAAHVSLTATIAARTHPEFAPQPPRPVVAAAVDGAPRADAKPHSRNKLEHLVFARYEYGYQGDTRKEAPAQMVSNADHSTALAHHPLEGAGPWFSFDHADWHRTQLTELRKDGVDVVLPIYRADTTHRKAYSDKGLLVLTGALEYMRRNGTGLSAGRSLPRFCVARRTGRGSRRSPGSCQSGGALWGNSRLLSQNS